MPYCAITHISLTLVKLALTSSIPIWSTENKQRLVCQDKTYSKWIVVYSVDLQNCPYWTEESRLLPEIVQLHLMTKWKMTSSCCSHRCLHWSCKSCSQLSEWDYRTTWSRVSPQGISNALSYCCYRALSQSYTSCCSHIHHIVWFFRHTKCT